MSDVSVPIRETDDHIADVVVVGYGAAACAAAIAAADAGASVLLLEKMTRQLAGGNTRVSGGIWFQSRDPDSAARYLRSLSGEFAIPEPVVRAWAAETHANSDWLSELGVQIAPHATMFREPEYPELDGSDTYVAGMGVDGHLGDELLWRELVRLVDERSVPVLFEARATALRVDSGRVVGVDVETPEGSFGITARRGVVLATGGFENEPELVRDYLGMPTRAVWGSPAGTGDGLRMAQRIGADVWHMTNRMATIGLVAPEFEAGFAITFGDAWGWIWVAADGQRFTDESLPSRHGHVRNNGSYEYRPNRPTFVVFDERTFRAGPVGPTREKMPIGWNLLVENYEWSSDNSAELSRGWLIRANSPRELALKLGVDADNLERTIDRYNASCAAGHDDQFQRTPSTLAALDRTSLYAFACGPVLGWTNGGPRRDERARVLDVDGVVIDGLFAAGSVSSTYSWCKDAGFHIADALAFGRVAGREAAS